MDQHVARPTPTPPALPRLCRGTPVHRPACLGAGYAAPLARLLGVLHGCYTIRHHAYAHIGRLERSRLCPRDRSRAQLAPCPAHPVPAPLGTGALPTNCCEWVSNPTNWLGCTPVSTTHRRSRSSDITAYGRAEVPAGSGHSRTW